MGQLPSLLADDDASSSSAPLPRSISAPQPHDGMTTSPSHPPFLADLRLGRVNTSRLSTPDSTPSSTPSSSPAPSLRLRPSLSRSSHFSSRSVSFDVAPSSLSSLSSQDDVDVEPSNPSHPHPLPLARPLAAAATLPPRSRPQYALANAKMRSHTSPQLYRTQSAFEIGRTPSVRKAAAYSSTVAAAAQAKVETRENVDVFLGGSCNPTTWRRDVAIPLLQEHGVSFFNPQVDDWYDALVYEESVAKESAALLLVVIDAQTRGIVSIHECIEHIFRGRRMVLVVQSFAADAEVDGQRLATQEIADLNGARACLRRLATKKNVPLFDDVAAAVHKVIRLLATDHLRASTHAMPRLRKLSSIVLNEWAGQFRLRSKFLRSSSSSSVLSMVSDEHTDDATAPSHMLCNEGVTATRGFVYLGGNLQDTRWRQRIAIPKLQQAGIPFYIPMTDYLSAQLAHLTSSASWSGADDRQEVEAERDMAQLVLFVIPNRSRAISAMTEAVELIANHYALLLVIEPLAEACELDDGTRLTGREFKDLVRARVYLEEMAVRHAVEVFQSVDDAVDSLIARLH